MLPAAAYGFNTVPICDPSGLNSHGLVWETFTTPVRDFTPDYIIFPKPDSLEIGLSPNSSQNTRSYSLNQSVHYLILFRRPTLLLGRRTPPKLTSEAGLPRPDSLRIGLSPNSSQITRSYSPKYLGLIRSLLDPFRGSHTIIGTSDSS